MVTCYGEVPIRRASWSLVRFRSPRLSHCPRCELASKVTFSNPTTEELLKRAEDLIHQDQEYLKDFSAALDHLQKRQEEFHAEHPAFGSRYS